MAIVTISRQIGSRGGEIASGLASALRYHLVGREAFEALFEQYGMVEFNQVYDAPAGLLGKFTSRRAEVTEMLTKIVRALARHGDAVIVGRGGFAALRGLDDVIVEVRTDGLLDTRCSRCTQAEPAGPGRVHLGLQVQGGRERAVWTRRRRPWRLRTPAKTVTMGSTLPAVTERVPGAGAGYGSDTSVRVRCPQC